MGTDNTRFNDVITALNITGRTRCKVRAVELLALLSEEDFETFLDFVRRMKVKLPEITSDTPLIWEIARILGDSDHFIRTGVSNEVVIRIVLRADITTVPEFTTALALRSKRLNGGGSKNTHTPGSSRWKPSYRVFVAQMTASYQAH